MAEIVLGLGVSHTPMLTLDWSEWRHRAEADYSNTELNLSDGRFVTYAQLAAETGSRFTAIATPEQFEAAANRCQAWLDRAAEALAQAAPDVVIVVGDDQGELFSPANMPAISIYYGDEVITNDEYGRKEKPAWMRKMARGYAMDRIHHFPAAPDLARALIAGLIERHVDVGAAAAVADPAVAGFGHAFGFVAERLYGDRQIPMLPILLNTYFPPNVLRSARVHDIGKAVRASIEEAPDDLRVAVVASGGLSHFVVDEALDRQVIAGLSNGDGELLRAVPPGALNSGSSEILNWIMTAAIAGGLHLDWVEYEPIRRTPAGTGVGAAFACWR